MARIIGTFIFLQIMFFKNLILQCTLNEIDLPQGRIRGFRSYSENYEAYFGIPYATINERFQNPGPPPQWNKTFNAVSGTVKCKQIDKISKKPTGQEDCLVLNVYVPITSYRKVLPVLVFIHGGGFFFGSNSDLIYQPKYLIRKDIIVVTINYRLGAFGFLCLQTMNAPGNYGLRDQIAALQWIKNNIRYFGGDPKSITLYGQSVGAASISYFLLSSETEGLFHRVILSSGSMLVPYALDNNPIMSASRIANRMGYTTSDPDELFKIYKNASADDILKASNIKDQNDPFAPYIFRPCVNKSERSLVTVTPREIIETTLIQRNISIVVGYNNKEGIYWAENFDKKGLENLNNDFSKIIPVNIIFSNEEEKTTFVKEVKEFYFKNKTIGRNSYDALIDYFSDSVIMYPLAAMTKYLVRTNYLVYNYYFQYDSRRNFIKKQTTLASKEGATHADDLFYVFDPLIPPTLFTTQNDQRVINAMTSFWSNVAKTGNPSTKNIQWMESEATELNFLLIDKEIEMIPLPNLERLQFWNYIYARYKSY